jgi:hypothetical protein
LLVFALIGYGVQLQFYQQHAIANFEPVSAHIIKSHVVTIGKIEKKIKISDLKKVHRDEDGDKRYTFKPNVRYSYTCDGRQLSNDRIYPSTKNKFYFC